VKRTIVYFIAGAVMDFIVCAYTLQILAHAVFFASVLSSSITIFSMFVIVGITDVRDERLQRALLILSYAVGNGVGTAAAMCINLHAF
jgi:uncharacterized protein YebE (UPF0316 family)